MIDNVNVLKTSWYLSPPWGKTMPPVEVNLLERVYLRTTKTFGYCCGIQWKHECWIYSIDCRNEIVHVTQHQIIGTGELVKLTAPKPLSWTEKLGELRDSITVFTGYKFRIVIGNQYRSGQDSIGWHADNEQSMGLSPAIASLSLGSCRKFQIKPRNGKPTDFWLEHGSLLVMHPGCQSTHLHQVPKTNKVVRTRINLTFRPHTGGGR